MTHHTTAEQAEKPSKPAEDFPLFRRATGRWAKEIRGKLHYFGPWADPSGACQRYIDQRDDLLNGRVAKGGAGLTIRELRNAFLVSRKRFFGIPRRCPLWPETIEAVHAALKLRPEPNDPADAGLGFVSKEVFPNNSCSVAG